ncbi:hypothetical protein [Streptomyces spiramyceticus]|uniref:hypothetical protein n=1 Tax=Streptomyces spiramyceticus TaxID=299717 RepID=UPI00237AB5FC|nr:hypothetical protein [Streptomyces spiramyceticus]
MAVTVTDAPGADRYEARVDGSDAVAGFTQYIRTHGRGYIARHPEYQDLLHQSTSKVSD